MAVVNIANSEVFFGENLPRKRGAKGAREKKGWEKKGSQADERLWLFSAVQVAAPGTNTKGGGAK